MAAEQQQQEEQKSSRRLLLPPHLLGEGDQGGHVVTLSPREAPTKLPLPRCADTAAEDPFHTDLLHVTERLSEFGVDYTPEAVTHSAEDLEITVTFDSSALGGGSRWRSLKHYLAGSFSAKIRAPGGDATSGLAYDFYLASAGGAGVVVGGDKKKAAPALVDKVGFEFVGKDKTVVQTSVFTDSRVTHELGFDSSAGFHEYTVKWYPSKIEWFVDGKLIRTLSRVGDEPFPEKPMYLYGSVWDASDVLDGEWAGKYVAAEEPHVVSFKTVLVPLCSLE